MPYGSKTRARAFAPAFTVAVLLLAMLSLLPLSEGAAYANEYDELKTQADQIQLEIDGRNTRMGELDRELEGLSEGHEQLLNEKQSYSEALSAYSRAIYREGADVVSEFAEILAAFDDIPSLVRSLESLEVALTRPYDQARSIQLEMDANEERIAEAQRERASLEMEVSEREEVAASLREQAAEAWQRLVATENNALAVAACRIAYSQPKFYDPGKVYGGTSEGKRISKAVGIGGVRSCNVVAAIAARWSGVDTSMANGCKGQWKHMTSSSRWIRVGRWNGSNDMLKPGDVLLRVDGEEGQTIDHSCVYVGHEIIEQVYSAYLKGTDADLGEPPVDSCFVSAHGTPNKTAAPCIGNASWAYADKRMTVFRCVEPEGSSKWDYL